MVVVCGLVFVLIILVLLIVVVVWFRVGLVVVDSGLLVLLIVFRLCCLVGCLMGRLWFVCELVVLVVFCRLRFGFVSRFGCWFYLRVG